MTISKRKSLYLAIAAILIAGIAVSAQLPNSGQSIEGAWKRGDRIRPTRIASVPSGTNPHHRDHRESRLADCGVVLGF
jgi:predicted lipoprotein